MPRVICDKCPCLALEGDANSDDCKLKYDVVYSESYRKNFARPYYCSDNCRLVKIVTKDGEIYPEEIKE